MTDKFAQKRIDALSDRVLKLEVKLNERSLDDNISLEYRGDKGYTFIKTLSIKEAVQHLIACFGVTYSPEKLNRD